MKTATEMVNYANANNYIYVTAALKHFKLIEDSLLPDEDVIIACSPVNEKSDSIAVAFTNKNIIIARESLLNSYVMSTGLDKIRNIKKDLSGIFDGEISIETLDKMFKLKFGKKIINIIYPQIVALLDDYKKKQQKVENNSRKSIADEIQKYANLLNQGIITKEEFDVLKNRLIGL